MKIKSIVAALAVSSLVCKSFAEPLSFDFKDPKGVNNVGFKLDAPLESISGQAAAISGEVSFDPEKPETLKGKIIAASASLKVPNDTMQGHMHGPIWLDVSKYPTITFESLSIDNIKTEGNKTTADISGNLTIKDITKKITAPVSLTFLKGKLKDRFPMLQGDLLVIRSKFTIKRSDYGINKDAPADKVSDEIELTLSLAGQHPIK
jgi:polyisoprenoid-binding protein YceI